MSAAPPCPFHSFWARSSAQSDTYPAPSHSPSPSSSSKATTPASASPSPLLLPSTCTCSASRAADAHHMPSLSDDQLADACRHASRIPAARSLAVDVLRSEARALLAAAERLSNQAAPPARPSPGLAFDRAQALALEALRPRRSSDGKHLRRSKGKLVWCGVGKSGLIGHKLHATSLSLGIQSAFLHPIEALHGDLGCVNRRDVVLVLSNSGATGELLALTPHLRSRGAKLIALCGKPNSELVRQSDAWIDCRLPLLHHPTPQVPPAYAAASPSPSTSTLTSASSPSVTTPASDEFEYDSASPVSSECSSFSLHSLDESAEESGPQEPEAWASAPAPSSSTTLALAMGDALIFAVAQELGHGKDHFARNHPNGDLGRRLRLEREQNAEILARGLATTSVSPGTALAPASAKPPLQPLVTVQGPHTAGAAILG